MKPKVDIEGMRDRIATLVTSDGVESGSTEWQKLEAAEATLDWVLGENDGYPMTMRLLEAEHMANIDTGEITCAECGGVYPMERNEERSEHHEDHCTVHSILLLGEALGKSVSRHE